MTNYNRKRAAKKAGKAVKRAAKKAPKLFFTLLIIVLVILFILSAYWYFFIYRKDSTPPVRDPAAPSTPPSESTPPGGTLQTGELAIHFLELGNKYTGDCIYIQIGDTDILIDGGSKTNSADAIETYVKNYCTDGILEYVIVTHAHEDHIAAFGGDGKNESLFRRFTCETIIDFPRTNSSSKIYNSYVQERDAEIEAGAVHYTALQCYNNEDGAKRSYELAEGVTMNFLYNYYYDHSSSNENNYSVCMYINQGEYNYLFTGDLEEKGEEYLVKHNELPKCKLFKAGHHGSNTSTTEKLLSVIQPEYVCVCCCAGSPEYTTNNDNTFPTQEMIDRVSKYTDKIFVTSLGVNIDLEGKKWDCASMNGNILVKSDGVNFSLTGSNNSTLLKDTDWFKSNRVWKG